MSTATLALTGAIAAYYNRLGHREPFLLSQLRVETQKRLASNVGMQIAPEQGGAIADLLAQGRAGQPCHDRQCVMGRRCGRRFEN